MSDFVGSLSLLMIRAIAPACKSRRDEGEKECLS